MKKYIAPALDELNVNAEIMIAGSITSIDGDADIEFGTDETPTSADAKSGSGEFWANEWDF